MFAAALITLREGLEAALIFGIVLSGLREIGRTDRHRAVWAGVAGVVAVSAVAVSAVAAMALKSLGVAFEGLSYGGYYAAVYVGTQWGDARSASSAVSARDVDDSAVGWRRMEDRG